MHQRRQQMLGASAVDTALALIEIDEKSDQIAAVRKLPELDVEGMIVTLGGPAFTRPASLPARRRSSDGPLRAAAPEQTPPGPVGPIHAQFE
jgi:hypothetical protein